MLVTEVTGLATCVVQNLAGLAEHDALLVEQLLCFSAQTAELAAAFT